MRKTVMTSRKKKGGLPRLLSRRRKWRADESTRMSRLGWHFFPELCRRATRA
ncbi:hypothetical protein BHE74_00026321, partial [Ensete ventricosum]